MSIRLDALAHAQSFIGVAEHPPGSNDGPAIREWLHDAGVNTPAPWCGAFMFSMFELAGRKLPIQYPAAVFYWDLTARTQGWAQRRPFKGDVVAFSWKGPTPDPADHIGIVERVLALPWPRNGRRFLIQTVEGNTGDAVRRRRRWVDPTAVTFIRVPG